MAISLVHLRTYNGANYVCAENGGGGVIDATRLWAQEWETFVLETSDPGTPDFRSGGTVCMRAANGLYVCAENGGGGVVNATRPWHREWETFTLEKVSAPAGDVVSNGAAVHFRTYNGHYLYAERGGGSVLDARATGAAQWETFTLELSPVPPQVQLTVDIVSVYCRDTEDLTGADELYLMGAAMTDAGDRKGILTSPININDGETRSFLADQSRIYDGKLPAGQSLALFLQAYDEDAAKDWKNRPKWVDSVGEKVAGGMGGAAVAALAATPIGWGTLAGLVAAGAAAGGLLLLVGGDKDDLLGELHALIPAAGPADEDKDWSFSRGGWYSSWDYTVHYHIRRR